MSEIALKHPGVEHAIAFPGLSINGFTNSSNSGIVFVSLKPFEERTTPELSGGAIAMQLNQEFGAIQDAFIAMFPPPPVQGLGTTGGFKLQIEDRNGLGYRTLDDATKAVLAKAMAAPELAGLYSSFQINVPQLYADLDRTKARQLGVAVTECSRRCRSIWARSTSTTSTLSAAPTACASRPMRAIAATPTTSAS